MFCERSKVTTFQGKLEEQTHHQRRAKTFFGRIDAPLDKKRCPHVQGDLKRRDKSKIRPIRSFENETVA
jgi:hypothetical protein